MTTLLLLSTQVNGYTQDAFHCEYSSDDQQKHLLNLVYRLRVYKIDSTSFSSNFIPKSAQKSKYNLYALNYTLSDLNLTLKGKEEKQQRKSKHMNIPPKKQCRFHEKHLQLFVRY